MKKIVVFLMAVVMCCLFGSAFFVPVQAESLTVKKIVSLVFDTSTSMRNDNKRYYANYALQSFCGMLNSEDKLYITYMSEAEAGYPSSYESVDLSSQASVQAAIENIKTDRTTSGTPYSAVTNAFNRLKAETDTDANTKYWLVVIADGEFFVGSDVVSETQVESDLKNYASQTMPNGTTAQVSYLRITTSTSADINDFSGNGVYVYQAKSAESIVDVMADMAETISGRAKVTTQISGNVVSFTSDVPLLNIAILNQKETGTVADIVEVRGQDGTTLSVDRKVSIASPSESGLSLKAFSFLIANNQDHIEKGTYEIVFDSDVTDSNIVVMVEPAIEFRIEISYNGKTVSDLNSLQNTYGGDTIDVTGGIYEVGSDNQIDPSLLPSGSSYYIVYYENGQQMQKVVTVDADGNLSLTGITLKSGVETKIAAELAIAGYNTITYSVVFTPGAVTYTVVAAGSDTTSIHVDELSSNTDVQYSFYVYANGSRVTDPDTLAALGADFSSSDFGGSVTYGEDGAIVFTPDSYLGSAKTGRVEGTIVCSVGDASASSRLTVDLTEYTIESWASTENAVVDLDDLEDNTELQYYFVLYADGVKIEDFSGLGSDYEVDFSGSDFGGTVEYRDGVIVFTPDSYLGDIQEGEITGEVVCRVYSAEAAEELTVHVASYTIVNVEQTNSILRTDFSGNTVGVDYVILKDGVQLTKSEISESLLTFSIDEDAASFLHAYVTIDEDGVIHVIPDSEEDFELPSFSPLLWYQYYTDIYKAQNQIGQVSVSLSYAGVTALGEVAVSGTGALWIFLSILLCIIIIALVLGYIIRIISKPRFCKNATIYYGSITENKGYQIGGTSALSQIILNDELGLLGKIRQVISIRRIPVSIGNFSVYPKSNNEIEVKAKGGILKSAKIQNGKSIDPSFSTASKGRKIQRLNITQKFNEEKSRKISLVKEKCYALAIVSKASEKIIPEFLYYIRH